MKYVSWDVNWWFYWTVIFQYFEKVAYDKDKVLEIKFYINLIKFC